MPQGPQEPGPADLGSVVRMAKIATGQEAETRAKQPTKRKGGLAVAKVCQESTTKAQRAEIAREAAEARCG